MKPNKNFVQISITVLFTSAAFLIAMASTGTGLFYPGPAPSVRLDSWDQARAMHDEYMRYRPLRVRYPEDDNHGERADLEGFIFKASDLQEILTGNKSGDTPDEVYFQFGQEGKFGDDFLGGLFHDSGNIRLIAVGLKNKQLLNTSTSGTLISVFDKADPCPPNCPK